MKIKSLLVLFTFLLVSSFQANAADSLTSAQIKKLIVGKTVHAEHAIKGFEFSVYFAKNGTAIRSKDGDESEGEYNITDNNMHCIDMGSFENCGTIVANGDGTYKRLKNGKKHVLNWLSITDGKSFK